MNSSNGREVPLLLLIEPAFDHGTSVYPLLSQATDVLQVSRVTTIDAGLAHLSRQPVSAVLLDLSIPGARDLSAIEQITAAAPAVAILLLTRGVDQPLARRAIARGATDFVVTDQLDTLTLCTVIAMMFERRAAERQRFVELERADVTLDSIGDAVLTTDNDGNVTYLNGEAEALTGWTRAEAFARPLAEVFDITDAATGQPAPDPGRLAIAKGEKVRLDGDYVLVGREGVETTIEQSAAPIHDRHGDIQGAVIVFRDVIVSRDRRLQMLHLAEHDALTDLPNRLLFNDRLARAIALARRYQRHAAVLFVDCDHFKHINDTLGHAAGDQVLKELSARLRASVRASDTVSRHGGDEFLILLSEVDHAEGARLIAEKVIREIAEPYAIAGHELRLTASVGVSVYPDHGLDPATLILHADTAMYLAKKTGRNQVSFYFPETGDPAPTSSSLESELQRALEGDEFVLHYQPTIDLETGVISGAEALIRWRHPTRGLVPPDDFIPAATASSLIVSLGRWALGEACRQAKRWQDLGLRAIPIAVNVSARQFGTEGFVDDVLACLAEADLQPRYLQLELTESALMVENCTTNSVLERLKENGVVLKVDDFGTGPSSLSYLQHCPVDVLKIDQSFVREIVPVNGGAPLVRAVIAMGKSLGCRVIAEGVETRQQFAFLRSEHCDEGQGYHFSPAVDADAFGRLLSMAPFAVPHFD
jgi:diguanylate cyclase (GGDEF)-like protein/PAS domain S-box-containing protein